MVPSITIVKNFILRLLFIIVLAELVSIFILNRPKTKVLSEATVLTPSPVLTDTPTPTASATLTASPSARPTKKPTPTPIPQPKFTSEQINGFIDKFAAPDQYNVDPNLIRHIALCESGFNPFAKDWIYAGLFQFGPITWQNIRTEMGEDKDTNLRFNAEEAVQTAAYVLHINDAGIWPNCVHN